LKETPNGSEAAASSFLKCTAIAELESGTNSDPAPERVSHTISKVYNKTNQGSQPINADRDHTNECIFSYASVKRSAHKRTLSFD